MYMAKRVIIEINDACNARFYALPHLQRNFVPMKYFKLIKTVDLYGCVCVCVRVR